ncbi:MAG: polyprenyl synthetase family protein [Chitinophagaceae bacterium]|nr:polyprenyl synthetase family protein [Oligoflexus sp.]
MQTRLYPTSETLHQACRYALAGRGKRIRPLLVMAAAEASGVPGEAALSLAIAIEMIHTYSLVHDDLPCMDDDELRRGRATTHVTFDEATALLVGDALLTDAFSVISDDDDLSTHVRVKAIACLARSAGGRGMVKGQALDMHWTGRGDFTRTDLDSIHLEKTGALIAASCVLGGIAGGSTEGELRRLESFGKSLGLVFQIVDDLLDGKEGTGKSIGKDKEAGKLTYQSIMATDEARIYASKLTDETLELLKYWGPKAEALRELGQALIQRTL